MIKLSRVVFSLTFLELLTLPCVLEAQGISSWRIKNRVQFGYEYDDNIFESPSDSTDHIGDSSSRFLFHSRGTRRTNRTIVGFEYQGGLQNYFNNSKENKLINEAKASVAYRLGNWQLFARTNGRLKVYLSDTPDYATGAVEVGARAPELLTLNPEIGVRAEGLKYERFSLYNYRILEVNGALTRALLPSLSWRTSLACKDISYDRQILRLSDDESRLELVPEEQRDDAWQLLTQLNYTKKLLINLSYSFLHNASNSYGYTYDKHQLILVFGVPLPLSAWLRGYGALQFKDYAEVSDPMFPIDIDTEREESNFLTLDLSRDFNESVSVLLRYSYYKNESIIRNRFYNKSLLTLGFDFRF